MSQEQSSTDLSWLDPERTPAPQEALARIKTICGLFPNLDAALLTVVATHPAVPREVLAAAVKR